MNIEYIGYLAAACFSFCAIPQLYMSIRDRHARGVAWGLLLLWFFGELLMLLYMYLKESLHTPLLVNYLFNLVQLCVILYIKFKDEF